MLVVVLAKPRVALQLRFRWEVRAVERPPPNCHELELVRQEVKRGR